MRLRGHGGADQLAAAAAARSSRARAPLSRASKWRLTQRLPTRCHRFRMAEKRKKRYLRSASRLLRRSSRSEPTTDQTRSFACTPPIGLGFWQADPRTGVSPSSWKDVTPWTLDSANQFRAGPPPSIYGDLFAKDLAEMKAIGGVTSSIRTTEQTDIAKFVTDNPVAQYNRLARLVAEAVPSDLETTARAFAHVSFWFADALFPASKANLPLTSGILERDPKRCCDRPHRAGRLELGLLIPNPPHPKYPCQPRCTIRSRDHRT